MQNRYVWTGLAIVAMLFGNTKNSTEVEATIGVVIYL